MDKRLLGIVTLIIAGETVFCLPFIIARVFRATLLDVFQLTNLELGMAFSFYGVIATLSYFPGGPLADRFQARKLMAVSLMMTAIGGAVYAQIPSLSTLKILFAYWGLTSVLLFWSALIRATRDWGASDSQGMAFGILDAGRGLFSALLGSATVLVFAALLPEPAAASLAERTEALKAVIWIFTGATVFAAVVVWFGVPESKLDLSNQSRSGFSFSRLATTLLNPAVWLQGLIVVCAYTGYKGVDDFGLYARDIYGFNEVQGAGVGTLALWVRPVAAFAVGLLADRIGASRATLISFLGVFVGQSMMATGWLPASLPMTLYMAVVSTSAMIFGLRGAYFALFGEAKVPPGLTGTAAGLVSVLGFTPDIFMGPLMGHFTDTYPGALGHQYLFTVLAGFSALGVLTTLAFRFVTKRKRRTLSTDLLNSDGRGCS